MATTTDEQLDHYLATSDDFAAVAYRAALEEEARLAAPCGDCAGPCACVNAERGEGSERR